MGGQDSKSCLLEDQSPYSFDTYVRVDRGKLLRSSKSSTLRVLLSRRPPTLDAN